MDETRWKVVKNHFGLLVFDEGRKTTRYEEDIFNLAKVSYSFCLDNFTIYTLPEFADRIALVCSVDNKINAEVVDVLKRF